MRPANIKKLFILLLIAYSWGCSDNPIKSNDNIIEGIYVLETGDSAGIYFADYKNIEFRKIGENPHFKTMWLDSRDELLLAASEEKVIFIDTNTQQKIDELIVPNTENPEPNIWYGPVEVFENKQNTNQCILVNRSIYAIDLKTREIDQIIWNVEQEENLTYIHDIAKTEDGNHLLLQLTVLGLWPIANSLFRYDMKQSLIKLDINTGSVQVIHDYTLEESVGSKYVFTTNDNIISYNPNLDFMLIFDFNTGALQDSFYIDEPDFIGDEYPNGDEIIIQSLDNGSFFRFLLNEKKMEPILFLDFEYIQFGVKYQRLKGGDIITSAIDFLGGNHSIINLSNGNIMLQFERDLIYRIIIKEK